MAAGSTRSSLIALAAGAAISNVSLSGPGWTPPAGRLQELRAQREHRRLAKKISNGEWREVLIGLKHTQHKFRRVERHDGTIDAFVEKIDLVGKAMMMGADLVANRPPLISTDEGFDLQREVVSAIRDRSHFDSLFHQAMVRANEEGIAALRTDLSGAGAVICLDDNEVTFAIGSRGPNMQPDVWERRWIIERANPASPKKPRRYLRVERHRVIDGVGVIEQEAYRTDSLEVLLEVSDLNRVALTEAIGPDRPAPPDISQTGLSRNLIVELANYRKDGVPRPRISKTALDMIDECAASMSRSSLAMEQHGFPKVRVPESQVDPKTNTVRFNSAAFVDPDKEVSYLQIAFDWDAMMTWLDKVMHWSLVQMDMTAGLLGLSVGSSGNADTAKKLRLQAMHTLTAAQRSVPNLQPPLADAFEIASAIESTLPLQGFDVGAVTVELRVEIPLLPIDRAEEQDELLRAGLTSRRRAIAEIHGESQVDAILEEIAEDEAARSRQQQAGIFGALPPIALPEPEPEEVAA